MKKDIYYSTIGWAALLTAWQTTSWLHIFNPIYFASPTEVLLESIPLFQDKKILLDLIFSLYRIIAGALLSTVIGIPLGITLGYYQGVHKYLKNIIDFLRSIPPILIYPLLLIKSGPGESARIGVVFFGGVTVLIFVITQGLSQTDILRKKYFKLLGANTFQLIRDVVVYEALPYVFIGLRTTLSLSIIMVLVTEMLVGAHYGLGVRIQNAQITDSIPELFAIIILVGIIGTTINRLLSLVEQKVVFWKN